MKLFIIFFSFFILYSCIESTNNESDSIGKSSSDYIISETSLIILGTVQDAGSPHIACKKDCCKELFANGDKSRKVVSLGLIDPENKKTYLIEATPDIATQLKILKKYSPFNMKETSDGIFLTHAHIGHYTGLMYFGKEAMNANLVPIYTMPKMKSFLKENGPWGQLVSGNNIKLMEMSDGKEISLSTNIRIIPFRVPHRDEYSETVGYTVVGPHKRILFIPDIDKWEKWDTNIIEAISGVDYAFIDGTFYDGDEINKRDISEIPHPFIIESMSLFKELPSEEKRKIYFIHFNHTNPALRPESKQAKRILKNGFNIASILDVIKL